MHGIEPARRLIEHENFRPNAKGQHQHERSALALRKRPDLLAQIEAEQRAQLGGPRGIVTRIATAHDLEMFSARHPFVEPALLRYVAEPLEGLGCKGQTVEAHRARA